MSGESRTRPSPTGGRWPEGPDGGARQRRASGKARARARDLRTNQTVAERKLWWLLRGRRDDGLKFRRQHPEPPFIIDFVELHTRLAVEIDGWTHGEPHEADYDVSRTAVLQSRGWTVIRFPNPYRPGDVAATADAIVRTALARLDQTPAAPWARRPHPPLWGTFPQRGKASRGTL